MDAVNENAWIRFRVHDEEYALPLDSVVEVTVARRPRLIPLVPREVAGVINVKGEPLPALDAGTLLRDRPAGNPRHALVLQRESLRIGLLVGSVSTIEASRDLARCEPAEPPPGPEPGRGLVRWTLVDGEKLGLLDHDALLGRVGDLLTRQAQHTEKGEPWPSAF